MSLTAAEKRAYAANATGARVIEGMTLTHPRFTAPFHLTAERAGFAGGDGDGGTIVYTPAPVHATQPGQDESGLGKMPVVIAALPGVVAQLMRAAQLATAPISMTLRTYLQGDPAPQRVERYKLTGVKIDTAKGLISASAGLAVTVEGARWPRSVYRVAQWPGLDRK